MLHIYSKSIRIAVVEERLATKQQKNYIASNHSQCFLKHSNRNGAKHLIFQPEFPGFFYVNGKYPGQTSE